MQQLTREAMYVGSSLRLMHSAIIALVVVVSAATAGGALAQERQASASAPASTPATASAPAVASAQTPVAEAPFQPQGFLREPEVLDRSITWVDRQMGGGEAGNGFYVEKSGLISGAGWITAGPGYKRWLNDDRLFVDASAAVSWRGYKMTQARVELPALAKSRVALGSQIRWQDLTQVAFYGEGSESLASDASEYRLKSTNLVAYGALRPLRTVTIGAHIGWLPKTSILPRSGSFLRDRPNSYEVFPDNPVFALSEQPAFVHTGMSVAADTRDFPEHPLRGGVYRTAWANYSDRDTGGFSFRRYEAEAEHFVPLAESRVVLALHGWLAASDTAPDAVVPFYFQPSLGGHNTVRAYGDYRFHDRNMAVVNIETRIAMMTHVDAVVFADAGNVAPRIKDLNLDKTAFGVGLRVHSRRSTFARLDVGHGDEGWAFFFRLSDPLQLSRLTKRSAALPFVP